MNSVPTLFSLVLKEIPLERLPEPQKEQISNILRDRLTDESGYYRQYLSHSKELSPAFVNRHIEALQDQSAQSHFSAIEQAFTSVFHEIAYPNRSHFGAASIQPDRIDFFCLEEMENRIQGSKNKVLSEFFSYIATQSPQAQEYLNAVIDSPLPLLLEPVERANLIRSWMATNQNTLSSAFTFPENPQTRSYTLSFPKEALLLTQLTSHQIGKMLIKASQDGHTDTVLAILNNGRFRSVTNPYLQAAFEQASFHGHTACVEALLDGKTERFTDANLVRSLNMAANQNHRSVVAAIVQKANARFPREMLTDLLTARLLAPQPTQLLPTLLLLDEASELLSPAVLKSLIGQGITHNKKDFIANLPDKITSKITEQDWKAIFQEATELNDPDMLSILIDNYGSFLSPKTWDALLLRSVLLKNQAHAIRALCQSNKPRFSNEGYEKALSTAISLNREDVFNILLKHSPRSLGQNFWKELLNQTSFSKNKSFESLILEKRDELLRSGSFFFDRNFK